MGFSKELIKELVDAGKRLLLFRSYSVNELLKLLQKTENVLANMEQCPPKSTLESLLPVKEALVNEGLLLHHKLNIQIAMACCINELTRITAPEVPYPGHRMKAIFRLFMVALKQLSSESASDHTAPLKILSTVANYHTFTIMMDLDYELIVEMFQLFLNGIRSDHSIDIFNYMKDIMTMVIEGSDENEISFQLLEPLLTSIKMDNKNTSPISWELGENVIKHCATKLQPRLREAVKSKNLDLGDYPEIVISLCQDISNGENMHLSSENPVETGILQTVQHNELKCSSTVKKEIQQTKNWKTRARAHVSSNLLLLGHDMDTRGHVIKKQKGNTSDLIPAPRESSKDEKAQTLEAANSPISSNLLAITGENDLVTINGYKVKAATAPTLKAIFDKYGDITANCIYKTLSVKTPLLEVLCDIVQRLQHSDREAILSNLEVIRKEVSDIAASKIEVAWLH